MSHDSARHRTTVYRNDEWRTWEGDCDCWIDPTACGDLDCCSPTLAGGHFDTWAEAMAWADRHVRGQG